jgi:hypothetical protein
VGRKVRTSTFIPRSPGSILLVERQNQLMAYSMMTPDGDITPDGALAPEPLFTKAPVHLSKPYPVGSKLQMVLQWLDDG